ncbi:accessory factor associated with RNA polymerase II [Malassezia psittaci]|uniref:Accessory factor associated with RNA polymerase II n=1 Tax=Malassezia psittaci TaxID=1821823 RepID=A0AAF0JJ16_9BASI|nr:accessory factor associated with RNA polymerase II [Malassezia psittaci]
MTDALVYLRAALKAFPEEPLKLLRFNASDGHQVDDVVDSSDLVIEQINQSSLAHDEDASAIVLASDMPSRILRTRDAASSDPKPNPDSAPEQFLTLKALIFAVAQRGERAGAYLRNAAAAKVVAIPALERPGVVEYLLGQREAWEGIVPLHDEAPKESSPAAAEARETVSTQHAPASKRAYVPDAADLEFVRNLRAKHEVVLLDRKQALAGSYAITNESESAATQSNVSISSTGDLFGLRALLKPRLEAAKRQLQAPSKSSAPTTAPNAATNAARRSRAQDPIILLSNSPTALVNMFNVKALLQDGMFVPPEEARRQARGVADQVVTIQTRSDDEGSNIPRGQQLARRVLVVDSAEAVNRLGSGSMGPGQDPWNRVIAVFTTGQSWQFKTYRWKDPRDLFKNAMGVYVRWNNEAPNPQVRDWNVTDLQVDRTKRHTDKQLVAFFWRALNNWLQRRKPHMQLS